MGEIIQYCSFVSLDAGPSASRIARAFAFFGDALRAAGAAALPALAERALRGLQVLYFELDDGEAVARFFEQLHQRQTMLARLVACARPGVDIAEVDLLRNFVLGHFGSAEAQQRAYAEFWLELERAQGAADGDLEQLGAFLMAYLRRRDIATASLYGGFRALFARELAAGAAPGLTGAEQSCEAAARAVLADLLAAARADRGAAAG